MLPLPHSIKMNNQVLKWETLSTMWICCRVAHCDESLGDEPRVQLECRTYYLWAEERGAHPTSIQAEFIGHQQHILDGGSYALDRHRRLIRLPLLIGIMIQIF